MLNKVCRKIEREDPNRLYKDRSLLPDAYQLGEEWKLYTQSTAAESAVSREHRVAGRSAVLSARHLDAISEDVPEMN
jgi:hypothetical protein